jgi:hypothetical protein
VVCFDDAVIQRFWSKVKIGGQDECWEWQAARDDKGYAVLFVGGKLWKASRVSVTISGRDVSGHIVMHSCDNPQCVNPRHLSLGTQKQNMEDMASRGRASRQGYSNPGMKNGQAKLMDSQVAYIKLLLAHGYGTREIGRWYETSHATIDSIRKGETWRHVEQAPLRPA